MHIEFESKLITIASHYLIRLPIEASKKLPSRGMVMVLGSINKVNFQAPLEPDGNFSHWFEVGTSLMEKTKLQVGQTASLSIETMDHWTQPDMPKDIIDQLLNEGLMEEWQSITTKAKWSWLRWIRASKNPKTRQKRIEVACSKLQKGDRRPCCFDQTRCTVIEVSKSGILLD